MAGNVKQLSRSRLISRICQIIVLTLEAIHYNYMSILVIYWMTSCYLF